MTLVLRFDRARWGAKTARTPQGFLRAPATLTRSGVFEYQTADGKKVRELRCDEEVFAQSSLDSLSSAPVTRGHPDSGMVTPENSKQLTVGFGSEKFERQDNMVAGAVTLMDAATIADAQAGKLKEISLGYQCKIDSTSGRHPVHGEYDQIQRGIVYNHIALGGVDWGRAGGEVGLRLDDKAAVCVDVLDNSPQTNAQVSGADLVRKNDRRSAVEKLIIGGIEFEVSPQVAQAFKAESVRHDSEIKTIKSESEKLQGRFDAVNAELTTVKAKLAEAEDPKRFDSVLATRLDLITKAKKVLGEVEIKGTGRQVMEQVLKHNAKDLDLTGKSDDYVAARFDALVENLGTRQADQGNAAEARAAALAAAAGNNAERFDSKKARERMVERNAKAWTEPLAISTQKAV